MLFKPPGESELGKMGRSKNFKNLSAFKETVFPCKCKQSHVLVFATKYIFSKTSLVKKKENHSINVLELKFNASFQFEDNLKICGYTRFVLL